MSAPIGRPSQLERTRRAVNKAISRAKATGLGFSDDQALEDLENAATKLSSALQASDDDAAKAKLGTALATVHSALHRIRHEAAKRMEHEEITEEEAVDQMTAWLKARGKWPDSAH